MKKVILMVMITAGTLFSQFIKTDTLYNTSYVGAKFINYLLFTDGVKVEYWLHDDPETFNIVHSLIIVQPMTRSEMGFYVTDSDKLKDIFSIKPATTSALDSLGMYFVIKKKDIYYSIGKYFNGLMIYMEGDSSQVHEFKNVKFENQPVWLKKRIKRLTGKDLKSYDALGRRKGVGTGGIRKNGSITLEKKK